MIKDIALWVLCFALLFSFGAVVLADVPGLPGGIPDPVQSVGCGHE